MEFFTLDDFDFKGKTVLLRADLNVPYDEKTKHLEDSERVAAHAETIRELSGKGAKIVVMAHQGRNGAKDFVSLEPHAKLLEKHVGKKVRFIKGLFEDNVLQQLKQLKEGEIVLLENTRFYDEETASLANLADYSKTQLVQKLSSVANYFVNDAFSVSHRAQASVVGFPFVLPSCAGRVMQKELEGLEKAAGKAEHPNVYVLAGAKPDDVFSLLKYACSSDKVDKILTSGIIGELCLIARGFDLGAEKMRALKESGFDAIIPELKDYGDKYPHKLELPVDLAVDEDGKRKEYSISEIGKTGKQSFDIGAKTIARYSRIISSAKTVYFKGPVGVYENPLFENGTREIMKAIEKSAAFSILGGGHSLSAVQKFGIDEKKFGHVSLAGGAVLEYLQGKQLPGVEALKASYSKFKR